MGSSLKAVFGLILLTGPVFAGFQQYTPWIMLPLIAIFTVAKITENAGEGVILMRALVGQEPEVTPAQSLLLLGGHVFAQAIVVPLFFAVAFGVSAMIYGRFDHGYPWYLPPVFSGVGVIAALIIARSSAHDLADHMMQDDAGGHSALSLMDRWNDMFDAVVMMPIDIFSLAREMVEHPDRALIGQLLEQGYDVCDNKFQRRVFFTYVRFVDGGDTGIENLSPLILDGLESESGWVAYDAAWAYGTLPSEDPMVTAKLREIAAAHPELLEEDLDDAGSETHSDDRLNFHRKVHEVLAQLDA